MGLDSRLLALVAGTLLLLAGRRVYWLVVGVVGFVVGFWLTAELLEGPQWLILAAGAVAGVLASVVAVLFQKVALAVAGFLIGSLSFYWWVEQMGREEQWWALAAAVAVGIAGALLVRLLFEAGLVLLSSVLGATLILEALQRPAPQVGPVFLVLVLIGVAVQLFVTQRRRRSE